MSDCHVDHPYLRNKVSHFHIGVWTQRKIAEDNGVSFTGAACWFRRADLSQVFSQGNLVFDLAQAGLGKRHVTMSRDMGHEQMSLCRCRGGAVTETIWTSLWHVYIWPTNILCYHSTEEQLQYKISLAFTKQHQIFQSYIYHSIFCWRLRLHALLNMKNQNLQRKEERKVSRRAR